MNKLNKLKPMTNKERLNEFLNSHNFNFSKIKTNTILLMFNVKYSTNIPISTGYRIVKEYKEQQNKNNNEALHKEVNDSLLVIFDN